MICPGCGNKIDNYIEYCEYCGFPIAPKSSRRKTQEQISSNTQEEQKQEGQKPTEVKKEAPHPSVKNHFSSDLPPKNKPSVDKSEKVFIKENSVADEQKTKPESINVSHPIKEPEDSEILSSAEPSIKSATTESAVPPTSSKKQENTYRGSNQHPQANTVNSASQTNSAFVNRPQPHFTENQKKPVSLKKLLIPAAIIFAVILFGIVSNSISRNEIVDIKVVYSGKTEAGVVLDENNTGISVTGIKKDGTKKELKNWKVENAKTLENDSTSTVTVQYKGIRKDFTVKCTSSSIVRISASYEGSLSAGTTIKSADHIKVVAIHKDNKCTTITQDCVFTPTSVTLKKDGKEKIHVTYENLSCDIELVCSDKSVTAISAEYTGELLAGKELKTDSKNIRVTATYKDGTKETVSKWQIEQPATLEWEKESEVLISYEKQTCVLKVFCTSNLKSITAEYNGSVEAGTKIANGNSNVKVTATYKDDKTEQVKGWTLDRDVTLEWGKEETLTVTYKDMNCPLKILCKSDIKELSAVYTGSVEAGTKISTENHNIDVTATYNDNKTEPVYGWIIENPVTLEENKESEIKITYQDKTCILKIKCPKSITIGMRNALKTAHSYLDYTAFSYSGLIDQLKFEGYSSEEAKYAVDNCGADWNEQAAKCARQYLDYTSFSRSGLYDQLLFEGFSSSQADYALKAVGY